MATKLFKSVILGAPASGKGTISSRIVKNFNLEHISSGDKLRLNIQNQTPVGKEVAKYLQSGQLVPDDLMIKFITGEIQAVGNKPWLLDGFPRTVTQAGALWSVQTLDVVLNLVVPFDVIIERVKGRWVHLPSGRVYNTDFNAPKVPGKDDVTGEDLVQREDDKPEVVRKRLEHYEKLTRPVVDYYRDKGVLQEFQGNTSDEIWPKVLDCLATYIPLNITAQKSKI
ncbi:GTP:AMP phosphotransferase AK3, mitochondrial [Tribolium castaneum]|uniref:GTP:AMP phosphotransferase, mitochondrial n=1 Tax=Tribolium castaneum TaxID=7070 RepID=D6WR14_TRICA|nr:PREDICTED: GTP:AMP phosphotransferase AK3, mitochondrial [Tribolium castaneum]EFA06480.1 GTP:AMP phosphotransferase AK3, mitochondrial-like Protein [Tribolium castaneum]|eukprot:XP_971037.1 PREDICTED: GTP:AMP phosphotransferase AK3, mitochondrial [Tribolium castaneum]